METCLFASFGLFVPVFFLAGISDAAEAPLHTNRLTHEKSPYLLQHAHNPVDWYPWGDEAFEKAKKENKPVFLSIGYSTCHWCHVMEEESFSNPETAEIMNKYYVSIKVDREERPDLDGIYMRYVMATTGGGGWPMTVFLTPDKKPFYGGTYFPPEDRFGMPGFPKLLLSIHDAWQDREGEILRSADSATDFLKTPAAKPQKARITEETFRDAFKQFAGSFDTQWGGFGRAPKFPMGHSLSWLLRYYSRSHDKEALKIVEETLTFMARGGLYDQLGGGFHRYSTDREWRVPHFEKMLYDQALLSRAYLECYQLTRNPFYAQIARETLDYVLARMTGKNGGFFSAEDADSDDPFRPGKKREGAFYVWKKNEIEALLSKDEAKLFLSHYGVLEKGNALQDPQHEFIDQNVLYAAHSSDDTAVQAVLAKTKAKLLAAREKRSRPYLDDKILTDWNGLMIASFAFASRVLDEPRYAVPASKAADFISKNLKGKNGRLLHRFRDGESRIEGMLDDTAFMIYGYLELYQATFEERWLGEAKELANQMIDLFWDAENKGFFATPDHAADLIARLKEAHDGAIPSGNSLAALDLILLSRITGETKYEKYAEGILELFSQEVSSQPTGYAQMLIAADFAIGPSYEIVVALDGKNSNKEAILKEMSSRFLPNKVVVLRKSGEDATFIESLAPFVKEQIPINNQTTVYICQNHACERPFTSLEDIRRALDA